MTVATVASAAVNGERLLHETTSLCRACKNAVPAQVRATAGGEVWMRKRCAQHGAQEVRLSDDAAWYERTRAHAGIRPRRPARCVRRSSTAARSTAGPATSHTQKVRLPVVTITSACNLDCPICYVHNKNDGAFHMARRGLPARPRAPARRPRRRARHHQPHRRRADAAPAAPRVPRAGAGGRRPPRHRLLERHPAGPGRGAGRSGWRRSARASRCRSTPSSRTPTRAAGRALLADQAALPRAAARSTASTPR